MRWGWLDNKYVPLEEDSMKTTPTRIFPNDPWPEVKCDGDCANCRIDEDEAVVEPDLPESEAGLTTCKLVDPPSLCDGECATCGVDDDDVVDPRVQHEMEEDAKAWIDHEDASANVTFSPDEMAPHKETHLPLELQEWMLKDRMQACFDNVAELLWQKRYEIEDMAISRLRQGYIHYGSNMYMWNLVHRTTNILEELADAIVYDSSGPTEL